MGDTGAPIEQDAPDVNGLDEPASSTDGAEPADVTHLVHSMAAGVRYELGH